MPITKSVSRFLPDVRQRWQLSASARQQSFRAKHKLRAFSTLPLAAAIVAQALSGCAEIDPYTREGVWRPNHSNDANLRAMVAVPSDLALAALASPADGGLTAQAVSRLRHDRVRALPDSGVAQIEAVGTGSAAPQAMAPSPANGGN